MKSILQIQEYLCAYLEFLQWNNTTPHLCHSLERRRIFPIMNISILSEVPFHATALSSQHPKTSVKEHTKPSVYGDITRFIFSVFSTNKPSIYHTLKMDLSSSFTSQLKPNCSSLFSDNISFSSSISPFPLQICPKTLKLTKPTSRNLRILAVAIDPQQEQPQNSPQRLLKELAERKKVTSPKKKVPPKRFILRPPLDDKKLADRFLNSPQLSLKSFPLLSSCLPSSRLNNADKTWMDEYLLEAKQALGYSLEPSEELGDDNPAKHFDTLLYLAFQHPACERTKARHIRSGHSRLCFLGQYVLELAFAEYFLQRYPRESPAPMRERVFGLIGKRNLPKWIRAASLQNLVFPYDDMDKLIRKLREPPCK